MEVGIIVAILWIIATIIVIRKDRNNIEIESREMRI